MRRNALLSCAVGAGLASALALSIPVTAAQRGGGAAPAAAAQVPTPHTADGKPDLNGRWGGGGGGGGGSTEVQGLDGTASA
jgi:hypothetical protein